MARGETPGPSGLELSVTMAEIHVPRMWMEEHPDKSGSYVSIILFIADWRFIILLSCIEEVGYDNRYI